MKNPTIVVLGSINMDLVAIAQRMPQPGETISGERFFTAPGGKGGNQAVAAAKLGADVKMVGRVGKDTFGPALLADLRGYGVNVDGVAEDPKNSSGVAMILLDAAKQNYILAVYGANMACDNSQLDAAKHALDAADALMLQLEIPLDVSLAAAQHAKSKGVRVIWDPAPAAELPPEAFAAADVMTPNQTEAEVLTGIRVTDVDSARMAARALLDKGVSAAVVKMGENGAFFATMEESDYMPPYSVEVVDTVAAGDAFGAGLTVALASGKSLHDAVRYGAAAGAMAVTKPGAQPAMPSRQEVEALLARSQ